MTKRKLIIVTSRFPWPIDKGDKLRAYKLAYYLSSYFDVTILAISESKKSISLPENMPFKIVSFYHSFIYKMIQLGAAFFSSTPFQVAYFYNPKIKKQIHHYLHQYKPDFTIMHLARTASYAPNYQENVLIDLMDAFSVGMQRRADLESNPIKKWFLLTEAKRMQAFENIIVSKFQKISIISHNERKILPVTDAQKSKIAVVPNGIDFPSKQNLHFAKKYDVLFVGNMHYPPNEKAAYKIIEEIIPLFSKKSTPIKFLLAGAHADKFKKFESNNLSVQGWVDDIQEIYLQSKIFLAPMEIGIGLQNKLLEAMICKLPVITTPLANEALLAKNKTEIVIAQNATEIQAAIVELLQNQELYHQLSENSFHFVTKNFNWHSITDTFVQYLQATNK
jgi:glycosyltransferase involved in cell wall biosynthesis